MAGVDLPPQGRARSRSPRRIDVIVQVARLTDGTRKIISIQEITGMEGEVVTMQEIFVFKQTGVAPDGKVRATSPPPACARASGNAAHARRAPARIDVRRRCGTPPETERALPGQRMNMTMILFSVLGFLAVVMALEGLYNLWASKYSAEARRMSGRLHALSGEAFAEVAIERGERLGRGGWFQTLIARLEIGARLTHWVESCGTTATAGEMLLLSAGLALLGSLLPALLGRPPILGLALAVVLAAVPWWRLSRRRSQRIRRFETSSPRRSTSCAARCAPATPSPPRSSWSARKCPSRWAATFASCSTR